MNREAGTAEWPAPTGRATVRTNFLQQEVEIHIGEDYLHLFSVKNLNASIARYCSIADRFLQRADGGRSSKFFHSGSHSQNND